MVEIREGNDGNAERKTINNRENRKMRVSSEIERWAGEGERLEKDRQCRGGVVGDVEKA